MGAKTIMERIKTRFMKNLDVQDWDVPTEIHHVSDELKTINTELVSAHTISICSKCGIHSHLNDNSCIKCDRGLV